MKKIFAFITAAFIILSCIPLQPSFAAEVTTRVLLNMVNPSFEEGFKGWTRTSGSQSNITIDSVRSYDKKFSLKISDVSDVTAFGMESDKVPAMEGITYIAKFRAYQVGRQSGYAYAYMYFYDESGARIGNAQISPGANDFASIQDFAEFSMEGISPVGTKFVSISLTGTTAYVGTVYFDKIEIWSLATVNTIMPENQVVASDLNSLEIGFVSGENAQSVLSNLSLRTMGPNNSFINWSSSDSDIIDSFGNVTNPDEDKQVTLTATLMFGNTQKTKTFQLIVKKPDKKQVEIHKELLNPGFEQGMKDWEVSMGDAQSAQISDEGYEDSKALQISAGNEMVITQSSAVWSERGLDVSANAKVLVEKGAALMEIRFFDYSNRILGTVSGKAAKTGQWTDIMLSKSTPPESAYVRIVFVAEVESVFTVDNIQIAGMGFIQPNRGFEEGLNGYDIEKDGEASAVVTKENKFNQEQSLLVKTNAGERLVINGQRIPVEAKVKYAAYLKIYLLRGAVDLTINFYDSSNKTISSEVRQITRIFNIWDDLGVQAAAPEGAAYASLAVSAGENTEAYLDDLYIGKQSTYLGVPLKYDYISIGTTGKDDEGNDYLYTINTDNSANKRTSFLVIDLSTNEIIKDIIMPQVGGSYGMKVGKDNHVYFGTFPNAILCKYIPGSDDVIELGVPVPGEDYVFDIDLSDDGLVFGGTYPNCYTFVYNPVLNEFKTFGANGEGQPMDKNEMYARQVAYDDENQVVYVGVGTHAKLYRYDLKTGQTRSVLPEKYKDQSYVMRMRFTNGKLFACVSPVGDLLVMSFDGDGNPTVDNVLRGSDTVSHAVDGISYYVGPDRGVMAYDYETNTTYPILNDEQKKAEILISPVYLDVIQYKDQEKYPGWTLILLASGTQRQNRIVTHNLTTHTTQYIEMDIPGKDYNPRSLISGGDGKVYSSAHLGGSAAVYDPVTNTNTLYYGVPQAESGVGLDGKTYFFCYTNSKIYEYNPEEEWKVNYSTPVNPKLLFNLGTTYDQDRPFGHAAGDGMIFVGTIPRYGQIGGAIAIYDTKTKEFPYVLRNVVQDQSVPALAYKDGILYGGTNIWGGIGGIPTQKNAKFFAFDVESKTKLFEMEIADGKRAVTTLEVGPDGRIWGMCEGHVFVYNPETEEMEYNENMFPELNYSSASAASPKHYGPQLIAGNDGYMYGNTQGYFFRINPKTYESQKMVESQSIFTAKDMFGNIYFTDFTGTWKYSGYDSDDVLIHKIELWIGDISAKINETQINLDTPPTLEGNRTMVPARFIVEALGGEVSWDGETQTGILTLDEEKIEFRLESDIINVNGKEVKMDTKVTAANGRTLLPLRAFTENLGMTVKWDEDTQKITVVAEGGELDENK